MIDVRTQLKNAIDTLAETAKNATDWVADKSNEARESVREHVANTARGIADSTVRAKDKVGEWVGEAAVPAAVMCSDAVSETKAAVRRANNELTDTIRKHPLASIAIGFGIGMVIGRQFRRD